MFANILQCGMFRGACTATDDDINDFIAVAKDVDPITHERKMLKQINQLQNQQEAIREELAKRKEVLERSQLASEKASHVAQCTVLIGTYKQNEEVIKRLTSAYAKFEATQTTLRTAELMHTTVEAEQALLSHTKQLFKGKTTDQIIGDQVQTESALHELEEMTTIVSQSEQERRAARYGITPIQTSVEDDLNAILGIAPVPIDLPIFPPVITTPPSASSTPYLTSNAASSVREFT